MAIITKLFEQAEASTTSSGRRHRREVSASPRLGEPKTAGFFNSTARRILFGIPAGILIVAGVVVGLGALKGGETVTYGDGIWLDRVLDAWAGR